jgi:N-acetylglucosaminyl-diphospho-decaprenol L-rhamnosyltransferase
MVDLLEAAPTDAPAVDRAADLSVVVVSYHCRDDVLTCVETIERTRGDLAVEVTVVDNGSTDGTLEALAVQAPQVTTVAMGTNAGFSRANNVGITRSHGRHVLVLNPDTRIEPGALAELVAFLDAHPRAGVAAPRLVNPDRTDQRTARSFPTPAAGLFGRRSPLTRWFPDNPWSRRFLSGRDHTGDEPFLVDWVSGAAMMVPATAIATAGAFDESYFLFWEDADWCRRLADAGFETWCVPAATIAQDEGSTRDHRWSPRVAAHFHRGAYLYWRTHHAPQVWNPLRWAAAAVLTARAAWVMALDRLRPPPAANRPVDDSTARPLQTTRNISRIPETSR